MGAIIVRECVLRYSDYPRGQLPGTRGRMRQRKLDALEKSRLQNVVESLPILLQLSFLLFFTGRIDYLYSVNLTVSLVVLGFALTGLLVYLWIFLVAVVNPSSPYQSSTSIFTYRHLKQISEHYRTVLEVVKNRWNPSVSGASNDPRLPVAESQSELVGGKDYEGQVSSDSYDSPAVSPTVEPETQPWDDEDATNNNRTACWVIETSGQEPALLSAARNIPSLRIINSTDLSIRPMANVQFKITPAFPTVIPQISPGNSDFQVSQIFRDIFGI